MYKNLVGNFINKLTYEEFNDYVSKNYSFITDSEKNIIFRYLKNDWNKIYDEDQSIILKLKNEVSDITYNEILKLLKSAYKLKK